MKPLDLILRAGEDLGEGLKKYPVVHLLSMQEVRHRYRRSKIGVFWITGNMAVLIATIGFVFTNIFNMDTKTYIPFLTASFVVWGFLVTSLSEGALTYVNGEELLKSEPMPLALLIYRTVWYNLIIAAHNFIIFVVVAIYFKIPITAASIYVFPGLALFVGIVFFCVLLLAPLTARFRDFAPIVSNILQIAFYITPVVWLPSLLSQRPAWILWNPFFHLLEIVRKPLLGEQVPPVSWSVSIGIFVLVASVALIAHGRFRDRILYWL